MTLLYCGNQQINLCPENYGSWGIFRIMEHTILTGARGGKYWLDENNVKHYVSQQGPVAKPKKNVNRLPSPAEQRKVTKRKSPGRYIGYFYVLNEIGHRIDDFKEWVYADSVEDARQQFEDDHWRAIAKGTLELDLVLKDKQ